MATLGSDRKSLSSLGSKDELNAAKKVALLALLKVIKEKYDEAVDSLRVRMNGSFDEKGGFFKSFVLSNFESGDLLLLQGLLRSKVTADNSKELKNICEKIVLITDDFQARDTPFSLSEINVLQGFLSDNDQPGLSEKLVLETPVYSNVDGVLEAHKADVQDNMDTICFCVELFTKMYGSLKEGSTFGLGRPNPLFVTSTELTQKFTEAFYKDDLGSLNHLDAGKRAFASVVLKCSESLMKFKETEFAQMFEKFKELACGPLATYLKCLELRYPSIRDRMGEDAFWAYVAARDSSYTAPAVDEDAVRGMPRHRVTSGARSMAGRSVGGESGYREPMFGQTLSPVMFRQPTSDLTSTAAPYAGAGSGGQKRRGSQRSHVTAGTAASPFAAPPAMARRPGGDSDPALNSRVSSGAPSASPLDGSGGHSSGSGGGASGSTSRSHAPPSVRGNPAVATVIAPGSVGGGGAMSTQKKAEQDVSQALAAGLLGLRAAAAASRQRVGSGVSNPHS